MLFSRRRSLAPSVTFLFAGMTFLAGCGGGPLKNTAATTSASGDGLSGQAGRRRAVVTTDTAFEESFAHEEGGWLVMYWVTARAGSGNLALAGTGQISQVDLTIRPGASALALGPEGQLFKKGEVVGRYSYPCGPQGARCSGEIPNIVDDIVYTCGPRGAQCRIKIPAI